MESYYSGTELKDIGVHIAREAGSFGGEMKSLARIALARLIELPVLTRHRAELLAMIPEGFTEVFERDSASPNVESKTSVAVEQHPRRGDQSSENTNEQAEFLAAQEIYDKAVALQNQNRREDALVAFDEVVRRFGDSDVPILLEPVATALVSKGLMLRVSNRREDALVAFDEVVRRFGDSDVLDLLESVATALVFKGLTLDDLDRLEDALVAFDEVVHRFGDSDVPDLLESVAKALVSKGLTLGRPEPAGGCASLPR